jgi:hypothetical protein
MDHSFTPHPGCSALCVCGNWDHHPVHGPNSDRLHLDLKGALQRLCRAQTQLPTHWRSDAQQAISIVQEIGSAVCPDAWSQHDQPEYPEALS